MLFTASTLESAVATAAKLPGVVSIDHYHIDTTGRIVVTLCPDYQGDTYTSEWEATTGAALKSLFGSVEDSGPSEDGSGTEWWSFAARMAVVPHQVTVTHDGYEAHLDPDGAVTITDDEGHVLGTGRWDGDSIVDCGAILGDDQDEADATYEALDDLLRDAIEAA